MIYISMTTLLDYPGVFWIQTESPSLPYRSANLLDYMKESTCTLNTFFKHPLTAFGILREKSLIFEGFGGKRVVGFLLKIELCQKRSKFHM